GNPRKSAGVITVSNNGVLKSGFMLKPDLLMHPILVEAGADATQEVTFEPKSAATDTPRH
ncbi:MAG: hypothetical protein V4610_19845, partial [Pseudomonadota bacterium]